MHPSGSTGLYFPGLEDIDSLFLATMDEMDKNIEDLIDIKDPVWEAMRERGRIEYVSSRGLYVPINLRTKGNNTVKFFSGYDDADNTPTENLEQARAQYGHIGGTQMYTREEVEALQGSQQLIDLANDKKEQLETEMNNTISAHLMSTSVADGRQPDSLGAIVTQSNTVHGINASTSAFWQPVRSYKTGTTAFALATEFREGVRKFVRTLTRYDRAAEILLICGEDVYDAFQAWSESKVEMSLKEIFKSQGWGDANTFQSRGQTIIYSPELAAKTMWGINTKVTRIRVPRTTNMVYTPWQFLENKMQVKKRNLLHTMAVYCRDRRSNGLITYS